VFDILSSFSTDALLNQYAACKAGALQLPDDELMILEQELIARPLLGNQAWKMLMLFFEK